MGNFFLNFDLRSESNHVVTELRLDIVWRTEEVRREYFLNEQEGDSDFFVYCEAVGSLLTVGLPGNGLKEP